MQTVLLAGATGFLGSHLLESLLINGFNVIILKRSTSDTNKINHLMEQVTAYDIDLISIDEIFKDNQIEVVLNTVCSYGRKNESFVQVVNVNLMFGLSLLEASLKHNIKLYINTDTLLDKNINIYSLSKKQMVEYLEFYSNEIQVVNIRPELMYGSKDTDTKFIPWVINQLKAKAEKIDLTLGEQLRDFIHIKDVVAAYMLVLSKFRMLSSFTEFDLGTGSSIEVKEFLMKLKGYYEIEHGETNTILNFGAVPYRKEEVMTINVDNGALRDLGWKPLVSIESGIKDILGAIK